MAHEEDGNWKNRCADQDEPTVDNDTAGPLAEIVAPGFEDEELKVEEREGDVEGPCEQDGNFICKGDMGREERGEGGVGAVAEEGVDEADNEVAAELAGGKVVEDARAPPAGFEFPGEIHSFHYPAADGLLGDAVRLRTGRGNPPGYVLEPCCFAIVA